jgi:hypothetical protein
MQTKREMQGKEEKINPAEMIFNSNRINRLTICEQTSIK